MLTLFVFPFLSRDIEYEKSDSETSVYDSDFSDQEPDQDDEADAEEEEEDTDKRRKKKLLPPGSRKPKPSQRKSSKSAGAGTSEGSGRQRKGHAHLLLLGETRKSSRASVVEASLRHEAHKRMQEVEQQIRKFKRESSESAGKAKNARVSMYDLLKESCQVTEEINAVSLKHLLEREEEVSQAPMHTNNTPHAYVPLELNGGVSECLTPKLACFFLSFLPSFGSFCDA